MSDLQELEQLLAALDTKQRTNKIVRYKPYPKQMEFHNSLKRERLLIAANQVGKTYSAGAETAFHATGVYPDWFEGKRHAKPTIGWVAGVSLEGLRDGAQNILLGPVGQEGTGTIPKDRILQIARKQNSAIDFVRVRFGPIAGNLETFISFKSYDQGREKFQAASVNWIWFDEEPQEDIYSEGITRTNATNGIIYITFTPLKGITEVVRRFLFEPSEDRAVVNMTIDDAEHIDPTQRAKIIASYKPHELDARTRGVPTLGSGLIFPVEESMVSVAPFDIPLYWPRIGGLDFGWEHPFAAAELAYDRQKDIVYVIRTYRVKHRTPAEHAMALRFWGETLPYAWPHDGLQTEKGSGEQLATQYRKYGLNLTQKRATFIDGSSNVEPGLFDMLTRMQSGRFKVFSNLSEWFEEFRLYYREDGKVVKEHDDLISATRYAVMMLRKAKVIDTGLGRRIANRPDTAPGAGVVNM